MSRPILYQTNARDAATQLPVVVIDSTALVDSCLPDPVTEVPDLIADLPKDDFVIVYFASRAPKSFQVNWARKVHSSLPQSLKKSLKKVYVVHATWFSKALNKTLTPIVSPKFALKVHYIKGLAELAREMDITTIDISPLVYFDDSENKSIENAGFIPVPKHTLSVFDLPLNVKPNAFWRAAFTFLSQITIRPKDFLPLSKVSDKTLALVSILSYGVAREQKLRLFDYGPYVVLAVIKKCLVSLPEPLINLNFCPLPVVDRFEYSRQVFKELPTANKFHLQDLSNFARRTKLDQSMIAHSLAPSVMGLINPTRESGAIATRVLKNILTFWDSLVDEEAPALPVRKVSGGVKSPFSAETTVKDQLPRRTTESAESSATQSPASSPELGSENFALRPAKRNSQPKATEEWFEQMRPFKGPRPSELPSEVLEYKQQLIAPSRPNRKAFGKVAEIVRIYNDDA